jgi:hypothetical protein
VAGKTNIEEVGAAADAALAAATKYLQVVSKGRPEDDLEAGQVAFVVNMLTDASNRLRMLPDMLNTAGKADAVAAAEKALEAAQAAQRG